MKEDIGCVIVIVAFLALIAFVIWLRANGH